MVNSDSEQLLPSALLTTNIWRRETQGSDSRGQHRVITFLLTGHFVQDVLFPCVSVTLDRVQAS